MKEAIKKLTTPQAERIVILVLFLLVGITYIVYGIYGEKYIMWDGCNYFINVLADGKFAIHPRGRMTSDVLMQGFAVAAWHLGCTDPAVIGGLHGFGITFFTVLPYLFAILACLWHKREDYAKLILIYACMSLTFKGLFLQMESTMAVPLYLYQFVSVLLWEEKNEKVIQRTAFILSLICSVHMNEYFVFWDIILLVVVLVRVCVYKSLSKSWLAIGCFFVVNTIISYLDIKLFSDYVGGMSPLYQLQMIFQNKEYLVSCIAVVGIIVLSYHRFSTKWSSLAIAVFSVALFAYQIYWYRREAMTIGTWAFPTRLSCLGWGLLGPAVMLFVHFRTNRSRAKVVFQRALLILCLMLSLSTAFFNRRTGHEYHNYNTQRVLMCIANPEQGFLDYRETPIAGYSFNIDGTMRMECEELLVLRGVKIIYTILVGSEPSKTISGGYERYGVEIREEFFY